MGDGPRVFEEGAATAILAPDGISLWVGSHRVTMFESVRIEAKDGRTSVEVRFSRSHDPEVGMRIEENVRLARTIPWLTVVY